MHYSKGYVKTGKSAPELDWEKKHKKHISKSGPPQVDENEPDSVGTGPSTEKGVAQPIPTGPAKEGKGNTPVGPGKH